jgi:hypothetical protein
MDFKIISYNYEWNSLEIMWGKNRYIVKKVSPYHKNKLDFFIRNKFWPNVTRLIRKFDIVKLSTNISINKNEFLTIENKKGIENENR